MYYSDIIPAGMATKTVVPALPQSIQLRQEDLIEELDAFYADVTGNGLSEEYKAELREKDLDSLLHTVNSKKRTYIDMIS